MHKISPNTFKNHSLLMVRILFRLLERSNKIVTRSVRNTLLDIIMSNANWSMFLIDSIVEFGLKNPNRNVRQVCIEILRESIERLNDSKNLRNALIKCRTYISVSSSDSCDIVRASSKKIIQFLERYHSVLYLQLFQAENSVAEHKNVEANILARSEVRGISLGKARRVKIER